MDLGNKPEGVSKLVFGTDKLADRYSDAEIFALLDRFTEAGGNCIDTARVYCGGKSEESVGRWLRVRKNRERVLLSTKGCHPPLGDMTRSRLSPGEMRSDLEASLTALGVECVDLYWLHRDDPSIPAGEIIESLNVLIREGKIRAVGCSNWKTERIAQANRYAAVHGLTGFSASQIQWSLAETKEEIYQDVAIVIMNAREYAWYLENRMPVFAYASQAQGFFAKVDRAGADSLSEKTRSRFYSEANLKRLANAKALSERRGISISAAVLSYILCNRLPACAIIGPKNLLQLNESLQAADLSIAPEEADALYRI